MKILSIAFLVVYFLIPNVSVSQEIKGKVIDEMGNPIPFANIGIKGKNVGTVSDINGRFQITISNKWATDSLTFSSIGYQTEAFSIGEVPKGDWIVELKSKTYSMPEIIVRDVELVKKDLGNTKAKKSMALEFGSNDLGNELGALIKIKKPSRLLAFHGILNQCDFDSLFFRLNIYAVKGNLDFQPILDRNIFVAVKVDGRMQEIELDLRPFDIYVEDDVLVSLEQITDLGEGTLQFALQKRGDSYVRTVSLAKWYKIQYGGVGFYLTVETEK